MKKLVLKLSLILLVVLIFFLSIAKIADGYTDPYYLKFTTPKQSSLILGNSKALHGIIPNVLDSILQHTHLTNKFFNFSFSLAHSKYGPTYYRAISEKLNSKTKQGLFIITVDPWSISSVRGNSNDSSVFSEKDHFLGKTHFFNLDPNFEYLLRNYEGTWGNIIFNKFKKDKGPGFLHNDGWLEVNVIWDSLTAEENMLKMLNEYKNKYLPATEPSSLRLEYLSKTIKMLKDHGNVYLVRLPVHKRLQEVDTTLMPDFDSVMKDLAHQHDIMYYNFIDSSLSYKFNDGVHLHKSSSKNLSIQLGRLIKENK